MFIRFIKFSSYLLYTLAVLLFLLWYKFPVDALKIRIEKDLNRMTPALQWAAEDIALRPPFHVQLRNIRITDKKEKKPLLVIKAMLLRPDLTAWNKTGNISAKYSINLLDGTVSGSLGLVKDKAALEYDGTMEALRINNTTLPVLRQEYQRTVQGTLSGHFSGTRKLNRKQHTLQGQFTFAQGEISLQQPVLGMQQLDFERLETGLDLDTETVSFSRGKVTAPLFTADFQGDLHIAAPCSVSRIQLAGSFHPEPAFTDSLESPSLALLLKRKIEKEPLTFTMNGPLKEPGIFFTNLPPAFNKQMGRMKQQRQRLPTRGRAR